MRGWISVLLVIGLWQTACHLFSIPSWFLPSPVQVLSAMKADAVLLIKSLYFTARVTLVAFMLALSTGVLIGFLSHASRVVREGIFPFTILLQTTPVVSIAPLLVVWFRNDAFAALVVCSWLVCVYPMISSAFAGFGHTDPNLRRIFLLYRITPWKSFWHLEFPSALPLLLNGVRVSGGLALVGAIGAEFVAGTGGLELGLAYRLLMAAYNQETARLFAALLVVSLFGLAIHFTLAFLEQKILAQLRMGRRSTS